MSVALHFVVQNFHPHPLQNLESNSGYKFYTALHISVATTFFCQLIFHHGSEDTWRDQSTLLETRYCLRGCGVSVDLTNWTSNPKSQSRCSDWIFSINSIRDFLLGRSFFRSVTSVKISYHEDLNRRSHLTIYFDLPRLRRIYSLIGLRTEA